MKLPNIPSKAKELWETWDLRSFIILSLCLQAYLIMFATKRKRSKSTWWKFTIWFSYLFADWVADIAVGFISKSQIYKCSSDDSAENGDLLTLWAPFLLLHLGGPDTITAFALEDNELWVRHSLGVILQVLGAVYVLIKSFPKNKILVQTVLILIAGTIKYAERSFALYLASMQRFGESIFRKPDPGPVYEKLLEIYQSMKETNLPTRLMEINNNNNDGSDTTDQFQLSGNYTAARDHDQDGDNNLDDKVLLRDGYRFFQTFKGLIVGLLFSSKERLESREYFLKRNARDAFRLIEIELSFMYEVLHTKANVVRSWYGVCLRSVSIVSMAVAFLLFYLVEKKGFQNFDIRLTYALFFGAVVMEIMSFIKLVFSDWTVIAHNNFLVDGIFALIVNRKRWSQTVSQSNLIRHSRHDPPRFVNKVLSDYLGFERFLDQMEIMLSTKSAKVSKALKQFIFEELKEKSLSADNVKTAAEICEERGAWSVRKNSSYELYPWCHDIDYVESLIQWHIATELCYCKGGFAGKDEDGRTSCCLLIWKLLWKYILDKFHKATKFCHKFITGPCYANKNEDDGDDDPKGQMPQIAKLLSDYMLYLLIMQPTMMAPVSGNWLLIFQDTCAEAKRLFRNSSIQKDPKKSGWGKYIILFPYRFVVKLIKGLFCGSDIVGQVKACNQIFDVEALVKPGALKGYLSKSALFDARMLAEELNNIRREDRWTIISQVWVELLCYAAVHCKADVHAQQPSKGGELVTLVWLLMNHLGLGKQFYEDGQSQVKFVVGK